MSGTGLHRNKAIHQIIFFYHHNNHFLVLDVILFQNKTVQRTSLEIEQSSRGTLFLRVGGGGLSGTIIMKLRCLTE